MMPGKPLPDGRPDFRTLDEDLGPAEAPPAVERAGDTAAAPPPAQPLEVHVEAQRLSQEWIAEAYRSSSRRGQYTIAFSLLMAIASAVISAMRREWEIFTICAVWAAVALLGLWHSRKDGY